VGHGRCLDRRADEGPNGRESETAVSAKDARRQKPKQLGLPLETRGEAPRDQRSGEASTLANGEERSGSDRLMEQVVARGKVRAALARVRENRGSPGVDGMTVGKLPQYLMEHWQEVREQLLAGTYWEFLALPVNLNLPNRRMRPNRTTGGVAGE
jgi:hypothetical protein